MKINLSSNFPKWKCFSFFFLRTIDYKNTISPSISWFRLIWIEMFVWIKKMKLYDNGDIKWQTIKKNVLFTITGKWTKTFEWKKKNDAFSWNLLTNYNLNIRQKSTIFGFIMSFVKFALFLLEHCFLRSWKK